MNCAILCLWPFHEQLMISSLGWWYLCICKHIQWQTDRQIDRQIHTHTHTHTNANNTQSNNTQMHSVRERERQLILDIWTLLLHHRGIFSSVCVLICICVCVCVCVCDMCVCVCVCVHDREGWLKYRARVVHFILLITLIWLGTTETCLIMESLQHRLIPMMNHPNDVTLAVFSATFLGHSRYTDIYIYIYIYCTTWHPGHLPIIV